MAHPPTSAPSAPTDARPAPAGAAHREHVHPPAGVDLDRVGAVASFVCAVHCAAIPVLFLLGGAGFVPMLDNEAVGFVEWGFVGVAALIATTSAWRGWRAHRRLPVAIVLAGAALALVGLMVAASFSGHDHAHDHDAGHLHEGPLRWAFPALGLTVALAHLWNRRLQRSCCAADHSARA